MNELLTVAYHRAMEALEDDDWVRDDLRASDVIRIIGVHTDYLKAFDTEPEARGVDDWEEDDAAGEQIVKEVDALPYLEHPEDEERSGEGSGEDDSSCEEHQVQGRYNHGDEGPGWQPARSAKELDLHHQIIKRRSVEQRKGWGVAPQPFLFLPIFT
jgi:hypothetical protein